jgi:hypothetical protein
VEAAENMRGTDKIIRKETNCLLVVQNCAYRMVEVILSSNECNIPEN